MRVVTKQLRLESHGFHCKVALYLSYLRIKFDYEIRRGPLSWVLKVEVCKSTQPAWTECVVEHATSGCRQEHRWYGHRSQDNISADQLRWAQTEDGVSDRQDDQPTLFYRNPAGNAPAQSTESWIWLQPASVGSDVVDVALQSTARPFSSYVSASTDRSRWRIDTSYPISVTFTAGEFLQRMSGACGTHWNCLMVTSPTTYLSSVTNNSDIMLLVIIKSSSVKRVPLRDLVTSRQRRYYHMNDSVLFTKCNKDKLVYVKPLSGVG